MVAYHVMVELGRTEDWNNRIELTAYNNGVVGGGRTKYAGRQAGNMCNQGPGTIAAGSLVVGGKSNETHAPGSWVVGCANCVQKRQNKQVWQVNGEHGKRIKSGNGR